jgi:membrane protein DedA with SNARE-associated domain
MAELLIQLTELIQGLVRAIGYPGVAIVMFTENVFPPIPSELVMPFGGFLAGSDPRFSVVGIWFASVVGSVAGALLLYSIGCWAGDNIVRTFLLRYGCWLTISEKEYDRALEIFHKYGTAMVFFGRLIPLVRSLISIPAGADHMPLPKFILLTALGSAIWNGALVASGVLLGENWEQVLAFMERYQGMTMIAALTAIVLVAAVWAAGRLRVQKTAAGGRVPFDTAERSQ